MWTEGPGREGGQTWGWERRGGEEGGGCEKERVKERGEGQKRGAEGKWREKEQEGGSGMGGWAVRGERRLEGRESWGEMESGGTEVWGGVGEGRGQSRKREERRREGGERRTADTAATVPCPLHRHHRLQRLTHRPGGGCFSRLHLFLHLKTHRLPKRARQCHKCTLPPVTNASTPPSAPKVTSTLF